MPTLYMLLVVKRGRSEAVLERENEVLGMLVDEADPADGGDHQLSMLLSLPSFPEEPALLHVSTFPTASYKIVAVCFRYCVGTEVTEAFDFQSGSAGPCGFADQCSPT